jgi:hypothetical protein
MINEYWLLISSLRKKNNFETNYVCENKEKEFLNFILVLMGKEMGAFYFEIVEKFILNLWYS